MPVLVRLLLLIACTCVPMAATATVRTMPFTLPTLMSFMPSMTMTAMHEQVHQGTGQQQQKWEIGYDVGPMLGEQKISGDGKKSKKEPIGTACVAKSTVVSGHGMRSLAISGMGDDRARLLPHRMALPHCDGCANE
ncbi:exported hypothetical protein [Pseudomonas sp. OF001]|nr:exported hypothetical protein [Pseudomonas sp. OF001]